MYIVELFIKLKEDFKAGKFKDLLKKPAVPNDTQDEKEGEKCDHLFVPIDSTGRILACSKCGKLIKRKAAKTNPFD